MEENSRQLDKEYIEELVKQKFELEKKIEQQKKIEKEKLKIINELEKMIDELKAASFEIAQEKLPDEGEIVQSVGIESQVVVGSIYREQPVIKISSN